MFTKVYLISLPIFMFLDMMWVGLIAKNFYSNQIGFLMSPRINWIAVISFYLIFLAGLALFVIGPALEKNSLMHALLFGALFGLICYATYDLTNLATLKDWPLKMVIVDLVWGSALCATVSSLSYLIYRKIG